MATPNTYTCIIDDGQRELILTALKQCQLQGYYGACQLDREEVDLLVGMLENLPELEKAEPGTHHGLCY